MKLMLEAQASVTDVSSELSLLTEKICDHFFDEEAAMRSVAVPESIVQAHAREHDRIIQELVALHEAEMIGVRPNLEKLGLKAESWILHHFEEFDQPLVSYFGS